MNISIIQNEINLSYSPEEYARLANHMSDMLYKIIQKAFLDSFTYGWATTTSIINDILYVSLFNGVYILYPCGTLRWINNSSYTEEEIKRL